MKKQIKGFVLGVAATLLLSSLTVTALAKANVIEINPISIMVNGKVFQPKDAKGQDVMVFSYNGTTYAPLRALAETFGQNVGYDSEKNMVTVGDVPVDGEGSKPTDQMSSSDLAGYEEFISHFTVKPDEFADNQRETICVQSNQELPLEELEAYLSENEPNLKKYSKYILEKYGKGISGYTSIHYTNYNINEVVVTMRYDSGYAEPTIFNVIKIKQK